MWTYIQKEDAHELEIASLVEEYIWKIEEAVEYDNNETAEKLESEKTRMYNVRHLANHQT